MNEQQQLEAEKQYYTAMTVATSMHEKGVISADVLAIIQTNLLDKFRPISATLLSGIALTF